MKLVQLLLLGRLLIQLMLVLLIQMIPGMLIRLLLKQLMEMLFSLLRELRLEIITYAYFMLVNLVTLGLLLIRLRLGISFLNC